VCISTFHKAYIISFVHIVVTTTRNTKSRRRRDVIFLYSLGKRRELKSIILNCYVWSANSFFGLSFCSTEYTSFHFCKRQYRLHEYKNKQHCDSKEDRCEVDADKSCVGLKESKSVEHEYSMQHIFSYVFNYSIFIL
jgi:hypothetical protein